MTTLKNFIRNRHYTTNPSFYVHYTDGSVDLLSLENLLAGDASYWDWDGYAEAEVKINALDLTVYDFRPIIFDPNADTHVWVM